MDREEAINIVRKNIPHLGIGAAEMTEALNELIPELRESEDERIRKQLISIMNFLGRDNAIFSEGQITKEQAITYLEKQKEQKPVECSDCAKHLEGYISGRGDAEKKLLDEYGILIMPEGELHMKARWKPSEEQMEALRKAVNKLANTDVADSVRLSIMYDNLKKL